MTRASLASAAMISVCTRPPAIASRSATYSSSRPNLRASAERVAERAVAFALAAHGVDRRAVLQIDDSDDAHAGHASGGHRRREHEGGVDRRDIAADGVAPLRGLARPGRTRRCAARVAGTADAVAITMTAELSDAFRTKREGVAFVLDAVEAVFGDARVLTTAGELDIRGGGACTAVGRRRRQLGRDVRSRWPMSTRTRC